MCLLSMKQEGKQEEINEIFNPFINSIENSICQIINLSNNVPFSEEYLKREFDYSNILLGRNEIMAYDEELI